MNAVDDERVARTNVMLVLMAFLLLIQHLLVLTTTLLPEIIL